MKKILVLLLVFLLSLTALAADYTPDNTPVYINGVRAAFFDEQNQYLSLRSVNGIVYAPFLSLMESLQIQGDVKVHDNGAAVVSIKGVQAAFFDANGQYLAPLLIEHETVEKLTQILKNKKTKELAAKREAILNEIHLLSKKPAEVLVRIACIHLNMKPRELAKKLVEKGVDYIYANVLLELSKKNHIDVETLRDAISGNMITASAVKADSEDEEIVSAQISRLVYRASKKLGE